MTLVAREAAWQAPIRAITRNPYHCFNPSNTWCLGSSYKLIAKNVFT